jgi:hypothetical protein
MEAKAKVMFILRIAIMSVIVCVVSAAASAGALAGAREGTAATLSFNGEEFLHRWSQKGQHEFTPKGDEDLKKFKSMMTINVFDGIKDGEALAQLANGVLGNYQKNGYIMRTLSKPRTEGSEAEHFVAAVLQAPNVWEVAFARVLMFEGRGVIAVYSKRFYGEGDTAQDEMKTWFKANAVKIEKVLVSWQGIPSRDVLNKLPASR